TPSPHFARGLFHQQYVPEFLAARSLGFFPRHTLLESFLGVGRKIVSDFDLKVAVFRSSLPDAPIHWVSSPVASFPRGRSPELRPAFFATRFSTRADPVRP